MSLEVHPVNRLAIGGNGDRGACKNGVSVISCMFLPSVWGLTRIDVQMRLRERVGDDDGARV